jgi:hypothetical protein
MNKHKLFFTFLIVTCINFLQAQSPTTKINFKLQSFRNDKKVILRWAFEDADQWHYVNTLGVNIWQV